MSSKEELSSFLLDGGDENCAICWDKMETARRLPCGHFFHNSCLRSWLEQVKGEGGRGGGCSVTCSYRLEMMFLSSPRLI
jgi:hypothetical protein